jgi:signal transduction histidine kinase
VAHDFNNMLFAIEGYAGILHRRMRPHDPLRSNVEHILEASERAAQVTQALLAFSRKQVMTVSPSRPKELVARMERFLRRIIGEDVELRTVLGPDAPVLGDAGQIEQVLMNLATNARDAMPRGGSLTIETGLREVADRLAVGDETREPGTYVWISVTDSGTGIDDLTMRSIFEPFFTTKEVGSGTGLGLAIV